jgi:hypothetical protein
MKYAFSIAIAFAVLAMPAFTQDSRPPTARRAGGDWWSLQAVKRPPLPAVRRNDWPRNRIDFFILAKLEAEKLTPSPEADPRTLIRRLTFDLTGLPPTPEEVESFVLACRGEAKTERALAWRVDHLLSSPHYGERWARHWLDVVRFGESNGFEHDELRKNAWPYRDWVIEAFNSDLPYDEFARRQIAGDILDPESEAGAIATGFLVAGGYDTVGQGQPSAAMKAVVRQDELEDIVGTIGQTFLGLTVQCARCHDHKFDPVRTQEYYRLTATVAGVRHGERDVVAPSVRAAFEKEQAEHRRNLAVAQETLAAIDDPVRTAILAERPVNDFKGPPPNARWDFTKSLKDEVAGLEAELYGDATQSAAGLVLKGNGYAKTSPLPKSVRAKTLSALVRLSDLSQRGGGITTLQSLDGAVFDGIVFGEREAGRWMSGSDFFRRTQDFLGAAETDSKPVHVVISYHEDGTITAYRNGVRYGQPYKTGRPPTHEANQAQLLFGLRHTPAAAGKYAAGTILHVEFFDRALTPKEVAAAAGASSRFVGDEEIVPRLDSAAKAKREGAMKEIERCRALLAMGPPSRKVYAVVPRAPEETRLLVRGNPAQKGELLAAGGAAALGQAEFGLSAAASDGERRRKLAEWITSSQNPLFARVMVNRIWHYHFGVGLVETPSDFGFNGGRPSHPELLDWLADEFMRSGYSVKHMHRLIVESATYRQVSRVRPDAAKRDAGNRWLWRKNPLRLEAEAVRDSILAVAGKLNDKRGGPGYQDFKVNIRGVTYEYAPLDADDPALYRRSIYRTWTRSARNGLLDVLDCPDPSTTSPRRALTTTPLQALSLLNNSFVLRMADRFADRLRRDASKEIDKQIARAYEIAYGRTPAKEEIARARPVVEEHGLPALCRAILNSNEFLYVD